MTNNNIADISAFESLQSDQHTKTGMSQMAVFNDKATYDSAMKRVVSYGAELDKRTNEVAKKTQKLADEYKKIIDDFTKFRVALQKDLIQTKIPDQENLDDRERDIIITRSRNLLDSASFVEDRLSKGHANVKQAIFD